jgi:hypothetical protein
MAGMKAARILLKRGYKPEKASPKFLRYDKKRMEL